MPHGGVWVLMGGFKKHRWMGGGGGGGAIPPTTGNAVGGELPKNRGLDSLQIYRRGVRKKEGF